MSLALPIVPPAEVFFEPDVQTDEQITATHFFDFELRGAGSAIAPGYGDNFPAVSPDDGFQWNLDGQIEMRGQEWSASTNYRASVCLERIRRIVQIDPEEHAQEKISKSIDL